MSEEQLKEMIAHLRSELEHEREERNYFQLERDKINTFWEITKKVPVCHIAAPCCVPTICNNSGARGPKGRASEQRSGDGRT